GTDPGALAAVGIKTPTLGQGRPHLGMPSDAPWFHADGPAPPSRRASSQELRRTDNMRALMTAIVVAALLGGCATTEPHSTYEAASVPASPAGEWRGTASEFQAPYIGTAAARVTLNLNADGT